MTALETINANPLPLARLFGIVFREANAACAIAEMLVREDLCTSADRAHGGALMAFADTTAAMGTFVSLPEGASGTTTIESKTNFLGAAPAGAKLIATATPIHRGRQTQVWQTRIETEAGKLVALVSQTQMVLYPRGA
jgi:uncharacterized protein (TIGR00369 family)